MSRLHSPSCFDPVISDSTGFQLDKWTAMIRYNSIGGNFCYCQSSLTDSAWKLILKAEKLLEKQIILALLITCLNFLKLDMYKDVV